jgi:hypothetical protein
METEERDALVDDEFYDEFERETTSTRPSGNDDKGSIIDASVDAISRLSMHISSAFNRSASSVSNRGSLELSFLDRGKGGVKDVSSTISTSNLHSTLLSTHEAPSAVHG